MNIQIRGSASLVPDKNNQPGGEISISYMNTNDGFYQYQGLINLNNSVFKRFALVLCEKKPKRLSKLKCFMYPIVGHRLKIQSGVLKCVQHPYPWVSERLQPSFTRFNGGYFSSAST